jgi:hypothetical protein
MWLTSKAAREFFTLRTSLISSWKMKLPARNGGKLSDEENEEGDERQG